MSDYLPATYAGRRVELIILGNCGKCPIYPLMSVMSFVNLFFGVSQFILDSQVLFTFCSPRVHLLFTFCLPIVYFRALVCVYWLEEPPT